MEKIEFLKLLIESNKDDNITIAYRRIRYSYLSLSSKKDEKTALERWNDIVIFSRAITGGASGGSCWGSEAQYFRVSESNLPEFNFDSILEKICPSISFLKYRVISREIDVISETSEYTDTEYYGNYTEYKTKVVKVSSLYEIFKKVEEECSPQ